MADNDDDDELVAALEEARGTQVLIRLTGLDAVLLTTQLRLALRHPENTGPGAERTGQLVVLIEDQLAAAGASFRRYLRGRVQ